LTLGCSSLRRYPVPNTSTKTCSRACIIPVDCPCPNMEDIKCIMPTRRTPGVRRDSVYVEEPTCAQVENLVKKAYDDAQP
jgi:hypothetical protein